MKKVTRIVMFVLIFGALFTIPAYAAGEAEGYLEEFFSLTGFEEETLDSIGVDAIFSELVASLTGQGSRILSFALYVFGGVAAIALASLLPKYKYVSAGVSMAVASGIYSQIYELVSGVREALSSASELFGSLIPIMTGITLAGGGASSASSEALGAGLALGAVSGICSPLLLPMVSLMFALAAASSLGASGARPTLLKLRSVFLWLLGIATSILLAGLSLQTVISTAKDSAMMRAAKYSASGLIPIVGGTVSASLSTLGAGLSYAKSVVGAGAVYIFAVMSAAPFVLILAYRFLISLGAGLLDFLGVKEGAGTFTSFAFCFDALCAVYAVSCIIYVFEVILFMKSGVAIL